MKKLKSLDRYQKGVFLFMIVMVLAFTAAYFVTTSRKGFAYGDAILIPRQENGSTVYSGKIQGSQASFTVSEGQTVEFQYGDKIYGPYIYQEDPAAVPEDSELKDSLIGVEIRRGIGFSFAAVCWKVIPAGCTTKTEARKEAVF